MMDDSLAQNTINNLQHTISRLKEKIKLLEKQIHNNDKSSIDQLNQEAIQKATKNAINEYKLGSTILVGTENYLSLLLAKPCINCNNVQMCNRSWYITVLGYGLTCTITCKVCNTIITHNNQLKGVSYSHCITGSMLAADLNRQTLSTALMILGITHQSCKCSYHYHQSQMFNFIIKKAEESAQTALIATLDYFENIKKEKFISIGFDCSWSSSRNTNQASGEFLCLEDIPGEVNIIFF